MERAHGSGMVHVTKGLFDSTPVRIPRDRSVQRQIAALLDQVDQKKDSTLNHLARSTDVAAKLRQALLTAACTGRLTADWRAANEGLPAVKVSHDRARSERRSREMPVELTLPDVPDTYVTANLGDIVSVIEYGTSQRCDVDENVGIPVLRMGNIQDGRLDLVDLKYCKKDTEIGRLLLRDGDLLFNRTNSPELVGKSAVFREGGEYSFASYLIRVRLRPVLALPEYVNYWINSAWGRAWASLAKTDGVSQSNINGSKLALLPIPLPPIEEQQEIVRRVQQVLEQIDTLVDRIELARRATARGSQKALTRTLGIAEVAAT